jgi:exodeoxyribonuclease VII large subunit
VEVEDDLGDAEVIDEQKPHVLTVSGLNKQIKMLLEKNFPFLWVKGEISNLKVPGSGHIYFTLKDSSSQIRAIMFRGFAQGLKFKVEDGMEVLVRCRVTAYEPRGDYQLFCEVMEPVGFGALQIAFEQLKAKLQSEGLFEPTKKRPIPQFPTRIGIITSPTGAAIRDMLNILQRRSGGGVDITILPTSVQGDKAPGEIVAALNLANKMGLARFDVLIVGRGGGSIEDLWAFNTEDVARTIAQSIIPIISAVGHEVDFTIADFVADLRAPTPSAAAELVVKNKKDLIDRIKLLERQVLTHAQKKLMVTKAVVEGFSKRLIDPKRRLQDLMLRCDEISDRLIQSAQRYLQTCLTQVKFLRERLGTPQRRLDLSRQKLLNVDGRMRKASQRVVENKRNQFNQMALQLNGLSPLAILDRGYSIVKRGNEIIKESSQVARGDKVTIKLHKGELSSEIL